MVCFLNGEALASTVPTRVSPAVPGIILQCSSTPKEVRSVGISAFLFGFVLLAAFLAYHFGFPPLAAEWFPWLGIAVGLVLAGGIIALERAAREIPPKVLLGGLLGLIVSLLLGHLLTSLITIPLIGVP